MFGLLMLVFDCQGSPARSALRMVTYVLHHNQPDATDDSQYQQPTNQKT